MIYYKQEVKKIDQDGGVVIQILRSAYDQNVIAWHRFSKHQHSKIQYSLVVTG
jgi:hypothetical protein